MAHTYRFKNLCLESGGDPLLLSTYFLPFPLQLLSLLQVSPCKFPLSQEREGNKRELGFSCPLSFSFQLPYLLDGQNKITQSNAILRYIARKHNMCEWGRANKGDQPVCSIGSGWSQESFLAIWPIGGDSEEEKIRVDIMENQIMDFRMQLVQICYNSDHVSFLSRHQQSWGIKKRST